MNEEGAMNRLYRWAGQLSGCLAGVCAVLALLATPSSARADMLSNCNACCANMYTDGEQISLCVGQCMSDSGACAYNPVDLPC
ncbi:MAG TPA: hypothetical protein VGF84_17345, partial [Micromonosporaceae bacterium]